MTSSSSLALLRNALASRRKAKALALRLALAKAESMEASYGADLARPLWKAVGKAEKAVTLLTPSQE